ncbi:hypothetical protein [Nostoc flagelliforme]|nr:hypothetical protein [Nostoc flagelliforme]
MDQKQQFSLFDLLGMVAIAVMIVFLWTDNARLKQVIQEKESDNAACSAQLERQKAESEGLIKGVLLRR